MPASGVALAVLVQLTPLSAPPLLLLLLLLLPPLLLLLPLASFAASGAASGVPLFVVVSSPHAATTANGLFAADYIISLDNVNTTVKGGCIQNNCKRIYIQLGYIGATAAYTFSVTTLLAKGFDLIPFLQLRAPEEAEINGMDEDQIGEFAVDFVELLRDFDANPPGRRSRSENPRLSIQMASLEKVAQDFGRPRHMSIIDIGRNPDFRTGFADFDTDSSRDDKKVLDAI